MKVSELAWGSSAKPPWAAAADFAAGITLLPLGSIYATIDASLKLLARGRVVSASRLLTVCAADVFAVSDGKETLCATLLGTARNIDITARA
ncbi:hypothetical protein [Paucibacter toxinivorans]|uniref:Thioesterase superfamily protein n=1 Tax=Roseateles toxinivorans TaxID=270368 RepID=A0A4R6QK71_9BURK|nr:hypothetical protein DES47_104252 [Roseateles toxinivorans]